MFLSAIRSIIELVVRLHKETLHRRNTIHTLSARVCAHTLVDDEEEGGDGSVLGDPTENPFFPQ